VLLIWKELEFLALIALQPKCGKEIISLVLHSLLERNPSSIQFSRYGRRCTPLKKNKNMHVSLVMEGIGDVGLRLFFFLCFFSFLSLSSYHRYRYDIPSFFPSFSSLISLLLFFFYFFGPTHVHLHSIYYFFFLLLL
jgi:hypothetical protein